MADTFQPVTSSVAFSESRTSRPTTQRPVPVTRYGSSLVEISDASDVPDSETFDSAEFTDE